MRVRAWSSSASGSAARRARRTRRRRASSAERGLGPGGACPPLAAGAVHACCAARPRSATVHSVCAPRADTRAAAGALVAAVEELRAAEAAEATLRAAAEAALREAAAAFKAELFDKTEQLEALRAELQRLRAWQRRAAGAAAGAPGAVLPAQRACSSERGSPDRSHSPGAPRPRSPLSLRRSAGALLGACSASPAAAQAPSPGAPARGGAQARRPRAPRRETGAEAAQTPDGLDLEAVEGFWREQEAAAGGGGGGCGWLPPCAAGLGVAALAAELAALGIAGAAVRALTYARIFYCCTAFWSLGRPWQHSWSPMA